MNYELLVDIASWLFLIYACVISSGYLFAAVFSFLEIKKYKRENIPTDDVTLLQSTSLPPVSVLAPAYNEEANVVENVKSLLTVNYPSYEIVVINDGSKDNTLQRLIDTFDLVKDESLRYNSIPTQEIRGVYMSTHKAYKNLTVIDKANGGKADALNAGINNCKHDLICCIDVDCILEDDALLKLVSPFLNNEKTVIASGGIIRVANSCIIEDGRII